MIFVAMEFSLFPLLFAAIGLTYIGIGFWSYYGPLEAGGAPRGLGGLNRTWHGRGTACTFIPAGVFFFSLSLSGMVLDETFRRLLTYVALVGLAISVLFFIRPPRAVWPAWLRASAAPALPAASSTQGADATAKTETRPEGDGGPV
ncbi:MAG: hypothetical protein QOE92_1853 [Chloroflexota bacterium]|jgi:hypothetical protein|nr:hypothetical protein [Chloroflexota bacterium]